MHWLRYTLLFGLAWGFVLATGSHWSSDQYHLIHGDFNGDGLTDVLVQAHDATGALSVLLTEPGQTEPTQMVQSWSGADKHLGIDWHGDLTKAYAGDFNGDGRDDLLLQHQEADTHFVLLANLDGTFKELHQTLTASELRLTSLAGNRYHLVMGDFDGDGRDDVFFQPHSNDDMTAIRFANQAFHTNNQPQLFKFEPGNRAWHNGELNLDWSGDQSVVVAGSFMEPADHDELLVMPRSRGWLAGFKSSNELVNLVSINHKRLMSVAETWDSNHLGADWLLADQGVVIGDFDGNGQDDVLFQSNDESVQVAYASNGFLLGHIESIENTGWANGAISAGDFNGDRQDEIVVQANQATDSNQIVSFNGHVATVASTDLDPVIASPSAVVSRNVPVAPSYGTPVVGTTPVRGSVTDQGGAQYIIDMPLPKSTGGMQPNVSLVYNSQSNEGQAGVGWSLSTGAQAINRCGKTLALDGVVTGVTYTTADRLCLNGQRLVMIDGQYGRGNSEYRTQMASFQKIKGLGTGAEAHTGFEVTKPNGIKLYFGQVSGGPDGRIQAAGSTVVRQWVLSKVKDTAGNEMTYHYSENNTTGEALLEHILYTANPGASLAPRYKVDLVYDDRPAVAARRMFKAGSMMTLSHQLKRVDFLHNNAVFERYYLDYQDPTSHPLGKARLQFVTQCAFDNSEKCLAPVQIDWTDGESGWDALAAFDESAGGNRYLVGDWNADGISDLFIAHQTSTGAQEYRAVWKILLGGENVATAAPIMTNVPAHTVETIAGKDALRDYVVMDINGDGKSDILEMFKEPTFVWRAHLSNGLGPVVTQDLALQNGEGSMPVSFRASPIDIDADGLTDLVYLGSGGIRYRKNISTTSAGINFSESSTFIARDFDIPDELPWDGNDSLVAVVYSDVCCVANFNDDGKPDLRVRVTYMDDHGIEDPFGDSTEWIEYSYKWVFLQSTSSGYEILRTLDDEAYRQLQVVDVNGDGLDDVSYEVFIPGAGTEHEGRIELNTGTGFAPAIVSAPSPTPPYSGGADTEHQWLLGDYNGDGMSDRFFRHESGALKVMLSNGQTFEPLQTIASSINEHVSFMDLNGDGLNDLVTNVPGAQVVVEQSFGAPPEPGDDWTPGDGSTPRPCDINPSDCDGNYIPRLAGSVPDNTDMALTDVTGVMGDTAQINAEDTIEFLGVHWHRPGQGDLVSQVTDGFGNVTAFDYAPLTDSEVHRVNSVAPLYDVYVRPAITGSYVVSAMHTSNGVGGLHTLNYSYRNAMLHGIHGNLGFSNKIVTDPQTGVETDTQFYTGYPWIGRISSMESKQSDGTLMSKVAYTYGTHEFGTENPQRLFVYQVSENNERYEVGGELNGELVTTTESENTYDLTNEYGHLASSLVKVSVPSASWSETTVNYEYTNPAASPWWCLGLPREVTTVNRALVNWDIQTSSRSSTMSNSLYYCRQNAVHQNPTSAPSEQVRVTYGYDTYGNVNETTTLAGVDDYVMGNDEVFKSKRARTEYDQWGQYPIRSINCYEAEGEVDEACAASGNNPYTETDWDYRRGQVVASRDVLGNEVSTTLDAFGRATRVDRPDGTWSTVEYAACDFCGFSEATLKVESANSTGAWSANYLDAKGRTVGTETRLPNNELSVSVVEFNALGQVHRRSAPYLSGDPVYWTEYTYDLANRATLIDAPRSEAQTSGSISRVLYEGLVTRSVDANNKETKKVFGERGQVLASYDALNHPTQFEYDAVGQLVKIVDVDGNEIVKSYDQLGRVTYQNDPDLGVRLYKYDPTGQVIWAQDAKQQIQTFKYDSLGRLIERDELEGTTTFDYELNSNSNSFTQLVESRTPVWPFDTEYVQSFTHDSLGRALTQTEVIPAQSGYSGFPAAGAFEVRFGYDPVDGRLETMTYPETNAGEPRFKVLYQYDDVGALKAVVNANQPSHAFYTVDKVNAIGSTIQAEFGNDVVTQNIIDRANHRLAGIQSYWGGTSTVQNLAYGWDNVGNLLSRSDENQGVTEAFFYDDLYRLDYSTLNGVENVNLDYDVMGNITAKSDAGDDYRYASSRPHAVTQVRNNGTLVHEYEYDANGAVINRNGDEIFRFSFGKPYSINKDDKGATFWYGPTRARFRQVADHGDKLIETLSVGGGVFEREITVTPSSLVTNVAYKHLITAGGQTVAIHTLSQSSDGADDDGDGVINAADNCTLVANPDQRDANGDGYGNACDPDLNNDGIVNAIDLGMFRTKFFTNDAHADFNGDGIVNVADLGLLRSMFFAAPGPAGTELASTDATWYVHRDHLGSVDTITNEQGAMHRQQSFDAFGKRREATWQADGDDSLIYEHEDDTNRGFTGHEQLPSVGLVHMNGRIYDPIVGRFLSADPTVPHAMSSQSYNRYSYTQNNPLSRLDRNGFYDEEVIVRGQRSGGSSQLQNYFSDRNTGMGWDPYRAGRAFRGQERAKDLWSSKEGMCHGVAHGACAGTFIDPASFRPVNEIMAERAMGILTAAGCMTPGGGEVCDLYDLIDPEGNITWYWQTAAGASLVANLAAAVLSGGTAIILPNTSAIRRAMAESDEFVTVYHGSSKKGLESIEPQGGSGGVSRQEADFQKQESTLTAIYGKDEAAQALARQRQVIELEKGSTFWTADYEEAVRYATSHNGIGSVYSAKISMQDLQRASDFFGPNVSSSELVYKGVVKPLTETPIGGN